MLARVNSSKVDISVRVFARQHETRPRMRPLPAHTGTTSLLYTLVISPLISCAGTVGTALSEDVLDQTTAFLSDLDLIQQERTSSRRAKRPVLPKTSEAHHVMPITGSHAHHQGL